MRKRGLIVAIVILLAGGLIYLRGSRGDPVQKVFGNRSVFNAFADSQQVTAQRLHLNRQATNVVSLGGYLHGPSVAVTPAQAKQIQRVLRRPSSYDWGQSLKDCIVDYGVLFTFRSGQRTVQVALCFNCNWLVVFDGEGDAATRVNDETDFDPARAELVAIVKAIFPQDSEIQALK